MMSPTIHYKTIKYCCFSVAFIGLSLKKIAILIVNIVKVSNAYCLSTLINTECYFNKQRIWLEYYLPYSRLSSGRTFHISIIEKEETENQKQKQFWNFTVTSESYIIFIKTSKYCSYCPSKIILTKITSALKFACFIICLCSYWKRINIRWSSTRNHCKFLLYSFGIIMRDTTEIKEYLQVQGLSWIVSTVF